MSARGSAHGHTTSGGSDIRSASGFPKAFADRLPMEAIHRSAAGLFGLLGSVFIARALMR